MHVHKCYIYWLSGTKIYEVGDEGFISLPDGRRVTDASGALLTLPPGQHILIGPDGKALLDGNGEVCLLVYHYCVDILVKICNS